DAPAALRDAGGDGLRGVYTCVGRDVDGFGVVGVYKDGVGGRVGEVRRNGEPVRAEVGRSVQMGHSDIASETHDGCVDRCAGGIVWVHGYRRDVVAARVEDATYDVGHRARAHVNP